MERPPTRTHSLVSDPFHFISSSIRLTRQPSPIHLFFQHEWGLDHKLTTPTEADDKNAIDQSNIIDERTRGAAKSSGTYQEPGDEEGLPGPDDGTSRVAGGVH